MTRGAKPKPCGTRAAYRRHRANGERPCPACDAAQAEYNASRGVQAPRRPCPSCGTKTRAGVCIDCRHELEMGLNYGEWVVRGGIKVWRPWQVAS